MLDFTEEQRQEVRAKAEELAAVFGRSDIDYVESLILNVLSNQQRRADKIAPIQMTHYQGEL
jgi:hypothetical protein